MRFIVILLITIFSPYYLLAGQGMIPTPMAYQAAPTSLDGCGTDGLIHSWHMESLTVTSGTPAGCVASGEDDTGTATGPTINSTSPYDGTNSLLIYDNGAYDNVEFSTATTTLLDDIKVTGWAKQNTGGFGNGQAIFSVRIDGDNYLKLVTSGTSIDMRLQLFHEGSNLGAKNSGVMTTTNCSIGEDEWYYYEFRLKTGVAGNDTYLKICESDGTTCDILEEDKDWDAATGTTSTFQYGYANSSSTFRGRVDNGKVYNASGY